MVESGALNFLAGASRAAWYAIQVRSRSEVLARAELGLRGIETFLPTQKVKRKWSDRTKVMDLPLFPGYLFGRFDTGQRYKVLNAPGVAQIVGAGSTPVAVDEAEIGSIQALMESRTKVTAWPYLREGQRVTVEEGPLAGVQGIVVRAADGKSRVVVQVTLLQRAVAAEIEREWVGAARG